MAVKLRLRRMGKKKRPFYRIVAADSRSPRDGRFIEMIGTYDPIESPHRVEYKEDRILYWLKNGAVPSDTVRSLLRSKGMWLKWTLIKEGASEEAIAAELEKWQQAQEEKAKRNAEKARKAAEESKKKAEEKPKKEAEAEEAAAAVAEAPAEEAEEKPAEEAAEAPAEEAPSDDDSKEG